MNENDALYNKLTNFIQHVNSKQTDDIKDHIRRELEDIRKTLDIEIIKRSKLEKELKDLKSKHKILEKELRKNNVVIFNFEYKGENNILDFTIQKLNQLLDISLTKEDINNIYEIGKRKENKPIIVKFTSYIAKQTILKKCKKLKGTNISIAQELTVEERAQNKILRQHLKKARSKNLNAYIKGERLYINGEQYKAEELIDDKEDSGNEQENDLITIHKSNSAPSTPQTTTQEGVTIDKDIRESRENTTKKRKFNIDANNILPSRSSSRLAGSGEKQATKLPII